MKYLLENGASIDSLGENLGLDAACFHGHWRLCDFLIERGADVNQCHKDTGESPLHATLCTSKRLRRNLVMRVLLAHGANPNSFTKPNVETGGFMRDCRTKGETPLHRAAAFGDEEAIQLLLDGGTVGREGHGRRHTPFVGQFVRAANRNFAEIAVRKSPDSPGPSHDGHVSRGECSSPKMA